MHACISNEVSFLFYLCLNKYLCIFKTGVSSISCRRTRKANNSSTTRSSSGVPKESLMAILTKDNNIKEWFSTWIEGLITYRKAILNKMSEFNKEVNESYKNLHYPDKIEDNMEARLYIPHMEFDMTKICSDIESVYNY